jgi:hypothetical protein
MTGYGSTPRRWQHQWWRSGEWRTWLVGFKVLNAPPSALRATCVAGQQNICVGVKLKRGHSLASPAALILLPSPGWREGCVGGSPLRTSCQEMQSVCANAMQCQWNVCLYVIILRLCAHMRTHTYREKEAHTHTACVACCDRNKVCTTAARQSSEVGAQIWLLLLRCLSWPCDTTTAMSQADVATRLHDPCCRAAPHWRLHCMRKPHPQNIVLLCWRRVLAVPSMRNAASVTNIVSGLSWCHKTTGGHTWPLSSGKFAFCDQGCPCT